MHQELGMTDKQLRFLMETGYVHLYMQKNRQARNTFEAVSFLLPESDIPLVALSNTYSSEKRYDQAAKYLQQALTLNPQSAFAKAHLGELLYVLGQVEKAASLLEDAAKDDRHGKVGGMAKTLLEVIKKKQQTPDAAVKGGGQ